MREQNRMDLASEQQQLHARIVRRLGVSNGTRAERVIHDLDGIDGPATSGALIAHGAELWERWVDSSGYSTADLLLGLDAGGILPTVAVAMASGLPYRIAWKLDLDVPHKLRFREAHAVRRSVFVYGIESGTRALLVDDEVTTGETVANLVKALEEAGIGTAGLLTFVEQQGFGARDRLAAAGVGLCSLITL